MKIARKKLEHEMPIINCVYMNLFSPIFLYKKGELPCRLLIKKMLTVFWLVEYLIKKFQANSYLSVLIICRLFICKFAFSHQQIW